MGDDIVEISTENKTLKNKIGSCDENWLEESRGKLLKQIDDEKRAKLIKFRMKKQIKNIKYMAYKYYNNLWQSEFDNIVCKRDKLQELNISQLKLEVHDTYKEDEKITTNFEPTDDSDVTNKAYLDEKNKKLYSHISHIRKGYNEFKLQYNKHSVEEVLVQRAVKTTIQILYVEGLFDNYADADKVLEDFLLTTRRRDDLSEQLNDVVQ